MIRQYDYRGQRKDGTTVTGGLLVEDLPAWVESKFHARWKRLTVSDPLTNEHVAGIGLSDGKRIWWAEKS